MEIRPAPDLRMWGVSEQLKKYKYAMMIMFCQSCWSGEPENVEMHYFVLEVR